MLGTFSGRYKSPSLVLEGVCLWEGRRDGRAENERERKREWVCVDGQRGGKINKRMKLEFNHLIF